MPKRFAAKQIDELLQIMAYVCRKLKSHLRMPVKTNSFYKTRHKTYFLLNYSFTPPVNALFSL